MFRREEPGRLRLDCVRSRSELPSMLQVCLPSRTLSVLLKTRSVYGASLESLQGSLRDGRGHQCRRMTQWTLTWSKHCDSISHT